MKKDNDTCQITRYERVLSRAVILFTLLTVCSACAMKRPVLYPNDHLQRVGKSAADQDVAACIQNAKNYGVNNNPAGKVAGETAVNAGIGAVSGAAWGSVIGDKGGHAGASAAAAGSASCLHGLFRSREPDPVFRQFVDRCLSERGYETVGWR